MLNEATGRDIGSHGHKMGELYAEGFFAGG